MIEQIDGRLQEWIGARVADTAVSLALPPPVNGGRMIGLYLLELAKCPTLPASKRLPLQILLRYLVTAWANDPAEEHRLLGRLILAALEESWFEVELIPLPAAAWQAFGLAPRPAFVLRVPLRQEWPAPAVRPVLEPPLIASVPTVSLHGRVVGPGDRPIAVARVELPALRLATRTDVKGEFRFPMIPAEPRTILLRVQARGGEHALTAEHAGGGEPLVIHFNPLET